jgi:ribosomal protein S18 acetylase RimI-like enzyme
MEDMSLHHEQTGWNSFAHIFLGLYWPVSQLRKINTASFPIQYADTFYEDVLKNNDENLNKFAYFNEIVVGGICCRVEHTSEGVKRLYIMTLAVLAAYRGREIGTQLFRSVLDYAVKNDFTEIALHVQISNNDAIRFYTEKFGFQKGPLVENYYRRIDPPHCYLLYKNLDVEDLNNDSPTK